MLQNEQEENHHLYLSGCDSGRKLVCLEGEQQLDDHNSVINIKCDESEHILHAALEDKKKKESGCEHASWVVMNPFI